MLLCWHKLCPQLPLIRLHFPGLSNTTQNFKNNKFRRFHSPSSLKLHRIWACKMRRQANRIGVRVTAPLLSLQALFDSCCAADGVSSLDGRKSTATYSEIKAGLPPQLDLWYTSEQCRGTTARIGAISEPLYAGWMPLPSPQRALTTSVRAEL